MLTVHTGGKSGWLRASYGNALIYINLMDLYICVNECWCTHPKLDNILRPSFMTSQVASVWCQQHRGFIYLFGVLRHFQHCTGCITMGSWKGRGNQYIQFIRVLYCKLPTNSKQLPAFPLEAIHGSGNFQLYSDMIAFTMCSSRVHLHCYIDDNMAVLQKNEAHSGCNDLCLLLQEL